MTTKTCQAWLGRPIRAVMMDISGVLYEGGVAAALPGSIEAVKKLRDAKLPFRFITNETQYTVANFVKKLNGLGYDLHESELIAPAIAVKQHLERFKLRPHLLVKPELREEFNGIDLCQPNCIVIGDAAEHFTYDAMNESFNLLLKLKKEKDAGLLSPDHAESILISMGKGRFYQEKGELNLDLGAYTAALEYATGVTGLIIGKPSPNYFKSAIESLAIDDLKLSEAIMVGDDILGDVKGAQDVGMRGVQVKTGKFRLTDLKHPLVKPDAYVDNLLDAVNQILAANRLNSN